MARNKKKDAATGAVPVQVPGRNATKADVLLHRQAEISAKVDALLASLQSTANAVNEKVSQEAVYIGKQNTSVFEKLMQENKDLRKELSYMAMQNEQVFMKLTEQLNALAQKVEAQAAPELDYDKLAEVLEARSEARDIYEGHADEVAPAAVEQLSIEDCINYDELAEHITQKLAESGVSDELAKKIADSLPPQEELSADYIASKVAEQIVVPVVAENGGGPVEVRAVVDYDQLAERVAAMTAPAAAESRVEAAAEETPVSGQAYSCTEDIARRVAELCPNDFDVIVDEEGCQALAGTILEMLNYDELAARISDRLHVDSELAVADAAEVEPISNDEIATLVTEKLAAGGLTEEAIADKTAAAISNYMPEVDTDEIADKVVAAILPSLGAAPALDYDAIVGGVAEKLAETREENDYDIVIDEEGLQKITDSISWKVTASTNAMLEGMDEKLAKVQGDTGYIRGALDAEPHEEVVETAAEETSADTDLEEIKSKLDTLLSVFGIDEEEEVAEETAEGEEVEEEAEGEEEIYDPVAEIQTKLDEILEKLTPAEEEVAEEAAEEGEAEGPGLEEINSKLDELLSIFSEEDEEIDAEEEVEVEDGEDEVAEIKSKLDEILEKLTPAEEVEEVAEESEADPVADELDIIHAKLDELLSIFNEEDGETDAGEEVEVEDGEDEVAEIKSKLDEILEKLTPAEEVEEVAEEGEAEGPGLEEINSKLDELLSIFNAEDEEAGAEEEVEVEDGEDEVAEIKSKLDEILEKLTPAEEEVAEEAAEEGEDEVAEIKSKLDEILEKLTPADEEVAEETAEESEADPVADELDIIHAKLDELLAALEPVEEEGEEEEAEEEYEDPLADDIQDIKSGIDELKNDPAIRELQGEVAELTARIDALTPVGNDEELAVLREEVAEISRQLEELKALIAGGVIVAAAKEEPPAEEPEPEAEPVEEPEEEEKLVTVSDLVDETEGVFDEPVDEAMESIFEEVAEQTVEGEAEPDGIGKGGVDFANMMKYNRSFIARIIQSSDDVKRYYGQIKNAMLAYKKVNSSIAWGAERFNKGRETIAKLKIRGKTLCLYLNLDPNEFPISVYHQVDVSDNKSMHGTPMMVKIKSPLGARKAIRLIDAMLAKRNGEKRAIQERDYAAMYPYETIEELIEDGLVKDVRKNK